MPAATAGRREAGIVGDQRLADTTVARAAYRRLTGRNLGPGGVVWMGCGAGGAFRLLVMGEGLQHHASSSARERKEHLMHPLDGCHVKIERAESHIAELEAQVNAFLMTNPYEVATKRDPQTRKPIYYVASVSEPSLVLAAIVGETVQSLRTALDYLAYELVSLEIGRRPPWKVYFPIFGSAAEYEAKKLGQAKGMGPRAIEIVDAVKPYKGGNDAIWCLNSLNVIDKHRLLITVGSSFQSVDLGAYGFRLMEKITGQPLNTDIHAFFGPADRLFPLETGDELFIDGPDAEVDEKLQFRFEVALYEPQVIGDENLVGAMRRLLGETETVISKFTRFFP
jgi:hypothetical protein